MRENTARLSRKTDQTDQTDQILITPRAGTQPEAIPPGRAAVGHKMSVAERWRLKDEEEGAARAAQALGGGDPDDGPQAAAD
jgi:hypothetical protein